MNIKRCAIYTRKSTDEGLEKENNTLHTQRERAENYIQSQHDNGWRIIPEFYDDGGYSGGNMERPALKKLIDDIKANRIDIVVVYKVDRISRSLMDFYDLVKVFESHGVSFVSVTQNFDTSQPMGKLMLNMLLSFAQFEREVIRERILDKFESCKKKGMWMGGPPPLGYDVADRKLVTNPKEAALVNHIYERMVALRSVSLLTQELNAQGYRTKHYISRSNKPVGGKLFNRNVMVTLLRNRLYIGEMPHKGNYYPAQHRPIIDRALFDAVQKSFQGDRHEKRKRTMTIKSKALLKGILVCAGCGGAMSPSHTRKGNKNYHYYVSNSYRKQFCKQCPSARVPAGEIESVVTGQLKSIFAAPQILSDTWRKIKTDHAYSENELHSAMKRLGSLWEALFPAEQKRILHLLVERVVLHTHCLDIEYRATGISEILSQLQSTIESKMQEEAA